MIERSKILKIFYGLMRLDTVNPPGHERKAAEYLKREFNLEGIQCEVQDLGEDRANFIAWIGSGDPILEFTGHLDVVPCYGEWHYPPLSVTEAKDRFFGRGSCDMKGGVASMCAAALALHKEGSLHGTLRLTFVADEEDSNIGIKAFLKQYPAAKWAILGEPTELKVEIAHRGVARFYIDIHGQSCHSALPIKDDTAVVKAARAILALKEFNGSLKKQVHDILPVPSLVITQVHGYEKDNVIPSNVRLLVDWRIHPNITEDNAWAIVERILSKAGVTDFTFKKRHFMPAGELRADNKFLKMVQKTITETLGIQTMPEAFKASSEQCFFLKAGTDALIFGPGNLLQAHTVDEYVMKEQLFLAAECYYKIAEEILRGEESSLILGNVKRLS